MRHEYGAFNLLTHVSDAQSYNGLTKMHSTSISQPTIPALSCSAHGAVLSTCIGRVRQGPRQSLWNRAQAGDTGAVQGASRNRTHAADAGAHAHPAPAQRVEANNACISRHLL